MPFAIILTNILRWFGASLIAKLVASFGFAFISTGAFIFAVNQLKDWVFDSISGLPEVIFNLLILCGIGDGLGYVFGAIIFKISIGAMSSFTFGSSS